MTLVEVMVALVLLMITMLPLGYLVTSEVHQAATAKDRLAALGVAEKWVEILGTAQDPPPNSGSLGVNTGRPLIPILPNGTSVPTETRGGTVFTVRAEYDWTGTGGINVPPDLCSSGGAQVLNLQVTVTWGKAQQVTDTTILNYPPPGIPQYGFYQLQFTGATGASDVGGNSWSNRVQAIPVTFTPTTTAPVAPPPATAVTIYPDQYGCVFAELIPGTYTVSVANPSAGTPSGTSYGSPSFVQNLATDGTISEPKSLTVANANPYVTIAAGVTTPLTTLGYDEGSTIGLSYPSSTFTSDGVTCPGVGAINCLAFGEGTNGSLGATPPKATMAWTSPPPSASTWSSTALPSSPSSISSTRIASVACATAACIGVGYGYGLTGTPHGVIIADNTTTPSTVTADTVPTLVPAVASLSQVICPTSTACVAWGVGTTGLPVVLAGTILSSGDTWNAVTLPAAMTTLNQVACSPNLNCVAVGNGSLVSPFGWAASGPLYGTSGAPSAGTWGAALVSVTLPEVVVPSTLTQVSCPTNAGCMAIGTGQILGVGPIVPIVISGLQITQVGVLATIPAWTFDAFPLAGSTQTSLSQLVCLPSNTCLVVGIGTVGGGPTQAVIYSGTVGAATLTLNSVPNTTSSLSQVACPSSSSCVAIGSGSGGPVILFSAIVSPWTWFPAASIPAGINSVSDVSCPNTTTCAITAAITNFGNPAVAILYGAPGTNTTWSSASLPSADTSTLYLTGISCTPTIAPTLSTCSAVGASPSSAVIMMSVTGPGGAWNDDTSDSGMRLIGSPTSSIPIELARGGLLKTGGSLGFWNPVAGTTTTNQITGVPIIANTTSIPDIFPFAAGYGVSAGDCPSEDAIGSAGSAVAATVPGNTATSPGATVPLAVLPIQVISPTGAPESGDVLTLTVPTNSLGCALDRYTLQPTGPDGLSLTEVPFGTYSLKVTSGSSTTTTTVITAAGAVTVGITPYLLPQPATVVGP